MEKLEYLIRTLTYQRSLIEIEQRRHVDFDNLKFQNAGKIDGINLAITEIYKLISEDDKTFD